MSLHHEWAGATMYRLGLTGRRIANVGCGDNAGAKSLACCGPVVGFTDSSEDAVLSKACGRLPVVLCGLEGERLRGFDTAVLVRSFGHMIHPWAWLAQIDRSVNVLALVTETTETMMKFAPVIEWTPQEVIDRLIGMGWRIEANEPTEEKLMRVILCR